MSDTDTPTLRIYLVRHAHAAWPQPGTRDFDRRLDQRGREEAARLAELMMVNGYAPDYIICSPAARCTETLEILHATMTPNPTVRHHAPLYSGSCDDYLDVIGRHVTAANQLSLMIVGHNPMTEETAQALLRHDETSLDEPIGRGFPTAGLLVIDSPVGAATEEHNRFVGFLSPIDA